jgi:hypothetical protein
MDHSVASVLGARGGCSSNCTVGGTAPGSPGQGGHVASTKGTGFTESGTIPVVTSGPGYKFKGGTGHLADPTGTISGLLSGGAA